MKKLCHITIKHCERQMRKAEGISETSMNKQKNKGINLK